MDKRDFKILWRDAQHGRSCIGVECPFCKMESTVYIWSLCGGGKRCENKKCDAKFDKFGGAVLVCRKKTNNRKSKS